VRVGDHGNNVLLLEDSKAAMERAMKVQESDFAGIGEEDYLAASDRDYRGQDRPMRRWRERYEEFGYDGQVDRQRERHLRGQPVTASTDRAV